MGQFFTPREIIHFCVEMMNPERTDLVIDPACGSGGFLLNTMDKVRRFAEENYDGKKFHYFSSPGDRPWTPVIEQAVMHDMDKISAVSAGRFSRKLEVIQWHGRPMSS